MALEYNSNLYPPLGYTFREADGTKFRATSWAELEQRVRDYRTQNGKPSGDVHGDVMAQVCKSSPTYCRDSNGVPVVRVSPRTPRADAPMGPAYIPKAGGGDVVARATNWLHRLLAQKRKGGVEFVPKPEARRRAGICAACPQQASVSGSCGGCMSIFKAGKGVILAGQAPVEKAIAGCRVLGEDTSLSVHIVQPPANNGALPANCWRRSQ